MASVKRTKAEAARSAELQAEIAVTLTKRRAEKEAVYHSIANRKCVEFVPHEVADITFSNDHEKQYITAVRENVEYRYEFKVAKDFYTCYFEQWIPKYGIYWRDRAHDKYFFVSDYRPFQKVSTVKEVKIWCCDRRACKRKNVRERFHEITIKRSGTLFHEPQAFIYKNNLQDVIPQWNRSLTLRVNGGSRRDGESNTDVIRQTFKKHATVVRGRGHAQGVGQLQPVGSGDPLNIAEAIHCKCGVHAAFARAKRQGEMEYV